MLRQMNPPPSSSAHGISGRSTPVRAILPTCLFFSGFCALAYQVSWARYLSMFLGATAPAYTIVLATFMGGLALGAWMLGKMADRTERPLRLYGHLELLVAFLCFVFPLLMDLLGPLYLALARPVADLPALRHILRAFLAVAVLAAPSILMGGTLPAATRFYVRSLKQVGSGVGKLYFVNAFGAVFGTLTAGFFLISWLGLHGTFWTAAAINALIGLWALRTSRRIDGPSACPPAGWIDDVETDIDPPGTESPFPAWVATAALVATASSGAASMIYEVSWIRVLTIVLGGSTYAFTVMLAAVILGIAIGSALVAALPRLARSGLGAFGLLEVSVAFVVLAMVPIYNRLSYIYVKMAAGIPREPEAYPQFLLIGFLLCVAVMLIPTVLLGATFPLATRLASRSMPTLGGGVGRAYAFNTAGTLFGTIISAHLLFPWLGLFGTFAFAASLNMSAGLLCLFGALKLSCASLSRTKPGGGAVNEDSSLSGGGPPHESRRPVFMQRAGATLLVAITAAFVLFVAKGPRLDHHVLSRGMFRSMTAAFGDYGEFWAWLASSTNILYYKDGAEDTVAVLDYRGHLTLQVNGKADASSEGDMPTQMCLGHLPMVIHPDPGRVLVVGLGSGATSAAILAHPEVELTTVELSPQVVEAASLFAPYTRDVLEDPRLDLVIEDAKAYLGLSRERFDIIISEPSNPWVAGNADLFTIEFFDLMRSRLAAGGFVAQWFHDYEMTDEALKTILRTFTEAFSYTRLFHCGAGRDFVLIGAEKALTYEPSRMQTAIAATPLVAKDLDAHLSIRSPLGVFTRNVLDDSGLRTLSEGGRLHRSRRPVLDFQAPRGVFLRSMSPLIAKADQRWLEPGEADMLITRLTGGKPLSTDEAFAEAAANITAPFHGLQEDILHKWVDATGSAKAHRNLARVLVDREWENHALAAYRDLEGTGEATKEDSFERWTLEARIASDDEAKDTTSIRLAIDELLSLAVDIDRAETWDRFASTCLYVGLPEKAAIGFEKALAMTEKSSKWDLLDRLVGLAKANRQSGNTDTAREHLAEARRLGVEHWALRLEIEVLGLPD